MGGRTMIVAIVSFALAWGASGCVVEQASPPPRGVVVAGPPPAPMEEQRPASPAPNALWVNGYWHWSGMQYTWIPGHWESPPPGQTWRKPQYSLHDGTWHYEAGGWTQQRP